MDCPALHGRVSKSKVRFPFTGRVLVTHRYRFLGVLSNRYSVPARNSLLQKRGLSSDTERKRQVKRLIKEARTKLSQTQEEVRTDVHGRVSELGNLAGTLNVRASKEPDLKERVKIRFQMYDVHRQLDAVYYEAWERYQVALDTFETSLQEIGIKGLPLGTHTPDMGGKHPVLEELANARKQNPTGSGVNDPFGTSATQAYDSGLPKALMDLDTKIAELSKIK